MEHTNETYEHESTIAKLGAAIKVATDDGNYEPAIDFIHDSTCRVCVNAMTEAIDVIVELEEQVRGLQACVYHTRPDEMMFGGEGWTWKQQARATEDRLKEAEARIEQLETAMTGTLGPLERCGLLAVADNVRVVIGTRVTLGGTTNPSENSRNP